TLLPVRKGRRAPLRQHAGRARGFKRNPARAGSGRLKRAGSSTLRSLVRSSAKHDAEVTVDHARRVFPRALKKLDSSQGRNPTLRAMTILLKQEPLGQIVSHLRTHAKRLPHDQLTA